MSEAWPNRRYIVASPSGMNTHKDREEAWAAARAISTAHKDFVVCVEHYDEGEPTGQARFKNGRLMDTVGDAR